MKLHDALQRLCRESGYIALQKKTLLDQLDGLDAFGEIPEMRDVMREFEALFPGKIRKDILPGRMEEKTPERPAPPPSESGKSSVDGAKKEIDKEKGGAYIDLREQLSALSETQLKIVSAIEKEPTHVDDIVEKTGLGTATVLTQLTVMTVRGIVRRVPGNRVALNVQRR